MKYFTLVFALVALASCDNRRMYRCDCSSVRGHSLGSYEKKYTKAADGVPECEAAEVALAADSSEKGVQCFFYRID